MELFVVVFLDGAHFLSDVGEFTDLVLNFILEEWNLIFQVINAKFLQHYYLVVAMVSEKALEAYWAQAVFAKSFDFLCWMDFTFALHELTYLIVSNAHFGNFKLWLQIESIAQSEFALFKL